MAKGNAENSPQTPFKIDNKAFFRAHGVLELPALDFASQQKKQKLEEMMKPFLLDDDALARVREVFSKELQTSLTQGDAASSVHSEYTFLPELLNGRETGTYLGMDFGATRFRIVMLKLAEGSEIVQEAVRYFHAPEVVRIGSGEQLFDFLAGCVEEFIRKENIDASSVLPMGFCFSFPIQQKGLNQAFLKSWSKGFNPTGVVGKDVVQLMNEAFKNRGVPVSVVCVTNNTTGTLVEGYQMNQHTRIGLYLGSSCNACYMEDLAKYVKFKDLCACAEGIVNTDWGSFGDNGVIDFVKTEFDEMTDKESTQPGYHTFEKYMSSETLGDTLRHILVAMAKSGVFFGGHPTVKLEQFGSLSYKQIALVEEGTLKGGTKQIKEVLNQVDLLYDRDDMRALQFVCAVLSVRAAQLVATCIASLLEKMNKPSVTIATTGSLYKHHPRLGDMLNHYTKSYAPKCKFRYILCTDGSGRGAALVGAIAKRLGKSEKARLPLLE